MVLTREGVGYLADLSWQLEDSNAVVAIPRHPLSIVSEREAWIDLGYKFLEPWVYPMGPEFTFVKAFEWEVREFPDTSERIVAPEGLCVELKWLDADEFAHWSSAGHRQHGSTGRARRARPASGTSTPRSPPAAARRCPRCSASRRRLGCTSSTTSPTPGCRRPSARSCSGCRRGTASMPESCRGASRAGPCVPRPGRRAGRARTRPAGRFVRRRGRCRCRVPGPRASTPGSWSPSPTAPTCARPSCPHAVRAPVVAVWVASLPSVAGPRAASRVAAPQGVPHPAGRRWLPRRRAVRAAGARGQRGPRARRGCRSGRRPRPRAVWSSTTARGRS